MMANVVSDSNERMPLQASATSKGIAGRLMTFPSRRTGTPNIGRLHAASFDARICNGKVIWLKIIAGMGIIKISSKTGKRTATSTSRPAKKSTKPAISRMMEVRDRKSSAPKTPKIRVNSDRTMTGIPHADGALGIAARRARSCQTMKAENSGTKKPCEKLGSRHH